MSGALEGIRVLDFTERIQGPYGTQMLADLGAEVVKVERVSALTPDGRPDDRYPPDGERTLYTSMFLSANRNKKSLALDLKSPGGAEVARRLVGLCDVVYENFRPGVMDRLGLGYERCRGLNPSVVYASATGYGPDGPYSGKPGQDVLAQALGGIGAINASAEGRPTAVGMSITDVMGGMNGAFAVVAALLHRERTGEGQHVQVSLLASAVAAQSEQAVHFLNTAVGEPARGSVMHAHPYIPPPYGFYATKDGFIALSSGRQVPTLCRVLGIEDLTLDQRFDSYWKRDVNRLEFEEIIEGSLRTRTTDEWLDLMDAEDMYAARVNSFAETFSDPQVQHMGLVADVDSPGGPLKLVAPPFTFSRTPATVRSAPPRHGEHTDEVLALAGYDADAIAHLRAEGAVS
jgi:succinate--hydroxymethylglutarate CoA-transferase